MVKVSACEYSETYCKAHVQGTSINSVYIDIAHNGSHGKNRKWSQRRGPKTSLVKRKPLKSKQSAAGHSVWLQAICQKPSDPKNSKITQANQVCAVATVSWNLGFSA